MKTLGISCLSVIFSVFLFLESYDYVAGSFDDQDSPLTSAQHEAILQGADPTDLFRKRLRAVQVN